MPAAEERKLSAKEEPPGESKAELLHAGERKIAIG